MLVDITERKQAESQQRVLIDELNHRVKNTLATVQSLASQTARHAEGLQDFVRRFETRIVALAKAHDLLTKRHWHDAPLEALIRELLAPVAGAARINISGPAIALKPGAALSLTMALNELSTNAVKYGALSLAEGQLAIDWRLSDEEGQEILGLTWLERGGPPVSPPTRRGFGSRLMERCIEGDLDGELDLTFEPSGVCCRMNIPTAGAAVHE